MDRNFWLSPESSGTEGRWETRPYQRAIADVIGLDDVRTVTWKKPGRVGYTKIVVAACGYFLSHLSRNVVLWQPTDGDAQDFVADEIDPMLRDVPAVREKLRVDPEKKSKFNTTDRKTFIGAIFDIKGGKSSKNYRRMTKDAAFYDELDGFDADVDHQGSPPSLGDKRLTQSPFPKSVRGSTPIEKATSLIEQDMADADLRFHRFAQCPNPKCRTLSPLSWANMKFDDDRRTMRHQCPTCGYLASYAEWPDMDAAGEWRAVEWAATDAGEDPRWIELGLKIHEPEDPERECELHDYAGNLVDWPDHVGFWCWGAYSYDLSWSEMGREFIKANEAKKVGKIEQLKTFVNMRLGEAWEDEGEVADDRSLYRRRENYQAEVPDGVQYLTAWADVQDDRFELEVCGWGFGEETWSIDYRRLSGDLGRQEIWDRLLEAFQRRYRRASGELIDIKLAGIDSGGHYTSEVYKFCERNGAQWLIPTKGHSEAAQPIATFPRKKNKHGVYLTMVGTDTAKELIYRRYLVDNPGPGYCHYPLRDEYDRTHFEQATAARRFMKYRRGIPYYVWDSGGRRDEVLDCRVGNLALVRILQQHGGVELVEQKPKADVVNAGKTETEHSTSAGDAKRALPQDTYIDGAGNVRRRSRYW